MYLTIEALRAVRETETSALELRRAAREEARRMVERAEAEAEALVEQEVRAAKEEARALLAQAEAEALREAEPIQREANEACARMQEEAAGRLSQAVALIVERIVKANGRS
ncbi:MAG: V/A-type H+/Na+-transporting ATPase subunit [Bacillota bacterium]|jgi:V/A-type H+-transporting ATPase subunit G/H|nr:V/A-type H+/Na+-transporting ATPase subunit [Bacillota bacterium]MDK2856346.1 V/A-type H+/Na+-transporting ATPase subunit [Bacillota bacterium]MDK2925111.1 V/A-type H+/Na+-transporting ATPase subunit [Bacillota bacterium]